MRALVTTILTAALVALPVTPADASRSLPKPAALHSAERAATARADQDQRITGWEITRGFRFTSGKWVFTWWAQMADGKVCSAQLVSRYNSTKTNKVIAYFRNEDCS